MSAVEIVETALAHAESTRVAWTADDVVSFLAEVRANAVEDRAAAAVALGAVREELLQERLSADVAGALYEASIGHLRRQLASARRWAVHLEQEVSGVLGCSVCGEPATYRVGGPRPVWCSQHGPLGAEVSL